MEEKFKKLKEKFPTVKEKISLKDHCTFHIGGITDYFLEISDDNSIENVLSFCLESGIKFYVIGAGSNLLISDKGFQGLVIVYKKNFGEEKISEDDFEKVGDNEFRVGLDASFLLSDIVSQMLSLGFSGFEWAAGIPGTLAGAINGNAGAFGSSISDNVFEISVLKVEDEKIKRLVIKKTDCDFTYRSSLFKLSKDYVILSVVFVVSQKEKELMRKEMSTILEKRANKQPKGFSVGSVFKNYEGEMDKKLIKKYPEIEKFIEKGSVPAGYLIENCNLKGTRVGDAQISPNHGNFIINLGNAKSENVLKLISLIKKTVKDKFGITIQEEIKYFE